MQIRYALDFSAFVYWLGHSIGGMFFLMFGCIALPVLGSFANPFEAIKRSIIRSGILWYWERDPRICALRHALESSGVITEPVTTHQHMCRSCANGFAMSLECDLMRRKRPFKGVILRCSSCGRSVDASPGPTLDEMAQTLARVR